MSAEIWVAISSGLIALMALYVSYDQGKVTREHNRLSVRPLLRLDFHAIDHEPICLTLRSVGLGPAIFRDLNIAVDGVAVNTDRLSEMKEALDRIGIRPGGGYKCKAFIPASGDAIEAGSNHNLLEFVQSVPGNPSLTGLSQDLALQAVTITKLKRLSFTVNYESIYGEYFEINFAPLCSESKLNTSSRLSFPDTESDRPAGRCVRNAKEFPPRGVEILGQDEK